MQSYASGQRKLKELEMVMAMHKLGRISLAESINITDFFARIVEQVTILNSDPNGGQ